MATQTAGQLYCGGGFGRKWNKAWERTVPAVFRVVWDVTVDKLPQDLFEQLLATAFWTVADEVGKHPTCCTVPERPTKTFPELEKEAQAWRQSQLVLGNAILLKKATDHVKAVHGLEPAKVTGTRALYKRGCRGFFELVVETMNSTVNGEFKYDLPFVAYKLLDDDLFEELQLHVSSSWYFVDFSGTDEFYKSVDEDLTRVLAG